MTSDGRLVYIGTYTQGDSKGIYVCRLDMSSGELRPGGIAGQVDNPSYLAIDDGRDRLYAVNELMEFNGRAGGGVSSFAIDAASGQLSLINQQPSGGGAPCYLTLDKDGRYLLAANYMGGNVAVIPVSPDGVLEEPSDIVAHSGSSLHPKRQAGPHPHSIVLDPAGDYVFVPDLGLDKVMRYQLNRGTGRLEANQPPWTEVEAGSGPRHLVFHPNGEHAYLINELNSTITALAYDAASGGLEVIQTMSTLPAGYSGANIAADLHLTPDGRFLFGSNRGHDSIAVFAVDQKGGRLRHVGFIETQGRTPRGFAIDPSGTYLLAANQDSHSVVSFKIDKERGMVTPTGHTVHIPSPVCLKFRRRS